MPPRLFLVVWLLCYMYVVLSRSQRDEDWPEQQRVCAYALNESNNTNHSYPSFRKSICRDEDYADCMGYAGTVSVQSDTVSYTHATSTIRVEINPNATVGQEQFYYAFCVSYNSSEVYELVACASNDSRLVEIGHSWEKNGMAHVRVGVFAKASYKDLLGCNKTKTIVAGNFGLKVGMELYNDQHRYNSSRNTSLLSPSPSPAPITNSTNNTYITGNLTFVPQPDLTATNSSMQLFQVLYAYDYGDNSAVEQHSDFNSTHLYKHAGNYSYSVEAFAVNTTHRAEAYHAVHNGTIVILEPVSNISVKFNNNNSIIADTKVYLHICVNGSFPVTVCWNVQPANSSNNLVRSSPSSRCSGWSTDLSKTCHNISENYPCPSYGMSFSDKGQYQLQAEFTNRVSCVRETYTFRVVAAAKPPIVATTTSAGVVVAIVVAVVVVLIILAVGGYLPYKRYRNHMIETADFKFIDLSEKMSVWHRFKLKMSRLMRSRTNTDKIGLVNLTSESDKSDSTTASSSSSSSSTFGSSNNNYNTI